MIETIYSWLQRHQAEILAISFLIFAIAFLFWAILAPHLSDKVREECLSRGYSDFSITRVDEIRAFCKNLDKVIEIPLP